MTLERVDQRRAVGDAERVALHPGEEPLVRVHAVAVRPLEAPVDRAELGADRCGARVGGVDVQPRPGRTGDRRDLVDRVDGVGGGGADGGAHEERDPPGSHVLLDAGPQAVGAHRPGGRVDRHQPQLIGPEAGDAGSLLDRGVRLARRVGDQVGVARHAPGPLAGGQEGAEVGPGRAVLDRRRRRDRSTGSAPGDPSSSASQSSTSVSTSVQAGPVDQSIPWTPRPAATRSPITAGPDVLPLK